MTDQITSEDAAKALALLATILPEQLPYGALPTLTMFVEQMQKTDVERYTTALISEELGEILIGIGLAIQLIGKAGRFGLDTPGIKDPLSGAVDMTKTPRNMLEIELGDLKAAIRYASARGVVSGDVIDVRADQKFRKLIDPESRDNLGRRLAP